MRAALTAVETMEPASVFLRLGGGRSIITWMLVLVPKTRAKLGLHALLGIAGSVTIAQLDQSLR